MPAFSRASPYLLHLNHGEARFRGESQRQTLPAPGSAIHLCDVRVLDGPLPLILCQPDCFQGVNLSYPKGPHFTQCRFVSDSLGTSQPVEIDTRQNGQPQVGKARLWGGRGWPIVAMSVSLLV